MTDLHQADLAVIKSLQQQLRDANKVVIELRAHITEQWGRQNVEIKRLMKSENDLVDEIELLHKHIAELETQLSLAVAAEFIADMTDKTPLPQPPENAI